MIGKLTEILKECGADAWELQELKTEGWEFYFIRKKLDQNRVKKITDYRITVYKYSDDGKYFGSASAPVSPDETEENLRKTAEDLCYQASLVKNRPYKLNQPADAEKAEQKETDIAKISSDFIKAVNSIDETKTEDINSHEIFVSSIERRLITSEGIDITEKYPYSMCEVVINARNEKQEIELYRMFRSGTCDEKSLAEGIGRAMQFGRDRLKTEKTPVTGNIPVVLSTDDAVSVYTYFLERISTQAVYQKISDWQTGKPVAEGITGDRMNIRSVRYLPNSSANRLYDSEGAPIRDLQLMKDSVPCSLWGNRMTSQYLGLEDTFSVTNVIFEGGTAEEEEIRSGRYLEVVEFSDFQVDTVTGSIFGEIRLAYYHDNDMVKIVSGGSVSGTMRDFMKHMRMSKEMKQYNSYMIPALTRLENVTVTGAE